MMLVEVNEEIHVVDHKEVRRKRTCPTQTEIKARTELRTS